MRLEQPRPDPDPEPKQHIGEQTTRASRLLLVPSFTELEWGIRPALEEWAEVASFDTPGVGDQPLPPDIAPDPNRASEFLSRWRNAAAERGLAEVDRHGWELEIGIGLNSGAVVAGNVGGAGRLEFSVIGDAVNVAARVESATRQTGDTVLLTERTRELLRESDLMLAERPNLALKGKREAVNLYAPVSDSSFAASAPGDL
jgi:class 3 adenylate cyclase